MDNNIVAPEPNEEQKKETRECEYCGLEQTRTESEKWKIKRLDNTEHTFCSESCQHAFYSEVANLQRVTGRDGILDVREVVRIHEWTKQHVADMTEEQLWAFRQSRKALIEEYRIQEQIATVKSAKLRQDAEGNYVRAVREARPVKKARAEGKSPLEHAIESYSKLLGIPLEDARKIVMSERNKKELG